MARGSKQVANRLKAANRIFAANDHVVQNPPCWRASSLLFPHWDIKTKASQASLAQVSFLKLRYPKGLTGSVPPCPIMALAFENVYNTFCLGKTMTCDLYKMPAASFKFLYICARCKSSSNCGKLRHLNRSQIFLGDRYFLGYRYFCSLL